MSKRVMVSGTEAMERLQKGVHTVADFVEPTLGAKGRTVAIKVDKYTPTSFTNDGVTVAREVIPEDEVERAGAEVVKMAAAQTEDDSGDGTTTTILLTSALIKAGREAIDNGVEPLQLRREMEAAVNQVVENIKSQARPAESADELAAVATISCRDANIGKLLGDVVYRAGKDGMVSLEDNLGGKTVATQLEGLHLRGGYIAKQFVNEPRTAQVMLKDVAVLITNLSLDTQADAMFISEQLVKTGKRRLIVFANHVSQEFFVTCYMNWNRQDAEIKILPQRVLTQSDIADGILRDIAKVTGGEFIDGFVGATLHELTPEHFGFAKQVVVGKHDTTIIPNENEGVNLRVEELQGELESSTDFERENIKERIARLHQACFTVSVGGVTETEVRERKTRVQDALNTAKAAMRHGIVPGGGSTLARAADTLSIDSAGAEAVSNACLTPLSQLAENVGVTVSEEQMQAILAGGSTEAIDFNSGDVVDAFKGGILDPAQTVIDCITNAAAQAVLLLTSASAIVEYVE